MDTAKVLRGRLGFPVSVFVTFHIRVKSKEKQRRQEEGFMIIICVQNSIMFLMFIAPY